MDHVTAPVLGYEPEQALENAKKIVARGFPNGAVLTCARCYQAELLDLEETTRAMMNGWPRCHGAPMIVEENLCSVGGGNNG